MATQRKTSSRTSRSRMGGKRSTSSRSSRGGSDSASAMVLQLVGGVVGDSLSESVSNLKNKVTE